VHGRKKNVKKREVHRNYQWRKESLKKKGKRRPGCCYLMKNEVRKIIEVDAPRSGQPQGHV